MYSVADAKNSHSHSSINPSDNFSETENLTNSGTNYFHACATKELCQSSSKLNNWVPNNDSDNEKSFVKLDSLNFKNFLKNWVLKEVNVPKSSVTSSLKGLNCFNLQLPSSFSGLLPYPKLVYTPMLDGKYVHIINWQDSLLSILSSYYNYKDCPKVIEYYVIVNVDGLPLFKHSPDYKLYPILIQVYKISMRPICVGIFSTEKCPDREMPSPKVFLKRFLSELSKLKENPLVHDSVTFKLASYGIYVCDSPARSALKGIKFHSGYSSCERCTIRGQYDPKSGHVRFLQSDCFPRSDMSFKMHTDKNHHREVSRLTEFGVNMVSNFPLDYMHLCCLGVMKRLMMRWKGVKRFDFVLK